LRPNQEKGTKSSVLTSVTLFANPFMLAFLKSSKLSLMLETLYKPNPALT